MGPEAESRTRPGFCQQLASLNGLEEKGFAHWVLHPGMLFGSSLKWWKPGGTRPSPHEGVDLCLYATRSGTTDFLTAGMTVPAPVTGTVVGVISDFLGSSVVIQATDDLVFILAHLHALPDIQSRAQVQAGEPVGGIADPNDRPAHLLPHVHLSVGHPHPGSDPGLLSWPDINRRRGLRLFDPLQILDFSPHILSDPRPI
jgi:murein DD-endopeptidase MepM/ murein hydrolase activator NlpD